MADKKTIKVSEQAHSELEQYKEDNGHTSFDSAIRGLFKENRELKDQPRTNAQVIDTDE